MRRHKYLVDEQLVVQVWNTANMIPPDVITMSEGVEGRLVGTEEVDCGPGTGELVLAHPLTNEGDVLDRAWNLWITMPDSDRARFEGKWHVYAGDALYRAGIDPTPYIQVHRAP